METDSMVYKISILGFGTMATIVLIAAAAFPTSITSPNAEAQNDDTSQQIRKFLIQAIQALDSGDNTEAIQQLQLAAGQMGTLTGVSAQSNDGGSVESSDGDGENDEREGSEEGSGEDKDESGDTDTNDEED